MKIKPTNFFITFKCPAVGVYYIYETLMLYILTGIQIMFFHIFCMKNIKMRKMRQKTCFFGQVFLGLHPNAGQEFPEKNTFSEKKHQFYLTTMNIN